MERVGYARKKKKKLGSASSLYLGLSTFFIIRNNIEKKKRNPTYCSLLKEVHVLRSIILARPLRIPETAPKSPEESLTSKRMELRRRRVVPGLVGGNCRRNHDSGDMTRMSRIFVSKAVVRPGLCKRNPHPVSASSPQISPRLPLKKTMRRRSGASGLFYVGRGSEANLHRFGVNIAVGASQWSICATN